jgi:hypothetical protein
MELERARSWRRGQEAHASQSQISTSNVTCARAVYLTEVCCCAAIRYAYFTLRGGTVAEVEISLVSSVVALLLLP